MNSSTDIYSGLHVLLVTEDEARGKALTKALRDHKARVGDFKSSRDPAALPGVDLLLIDARSDNARARGQELRSDVRARWASPVNVDFSTLVKSDGSVLLSMLSDLVGPLVSVDRALMERARAESNFTTSLSPLGPSRTLRALSQSGHTLLVELRHPVLSATVEVANELLVSASAARNEKRWEAWSALVRILGLNDAEVMVARRSFTAAMNIMEPVDQALEVAAQERHCSAAQIAAEEAEAERQAGAAKELPKPLDPRSAARGPGYTPPRPGARPAAPAAAPMGSQRTLMGMPVFSNAQPVKALEAAAAAGLPTVRPTAPAGQRPNATLLGVAPGAIPGLAELRAQSAALLADPPAPTAAAPTVRAPALSEQQAAEGELAERELPDFDPPTGRVGASDELLDTLDTLDELTMVAAPLSTPLPPPRASLPVNDNDVPLAGDGLEDEHERERALAQSTPSPVDLAETAAPPRRAESSAQTATLAQVADEDRDLDLPDEVDPQESPTRVGEVPKELAELATIPAPPSRVGKPTGSTPTTTSSSPTPSGKPAPTPSVSTTPSGELSAPGEETWVVQRSAATKAGGKKKTSWLVVGALALAGAVAIPLALRGGPASDEVEKPSTIAASTTQPAQAPANTAEPVIAPAATKPAAKANTEPAPSAAGEPVPNAPVAEAPAAIAAAEPTPVAAAAAPAATTAPVAPAAAPAVLSGDVGELVKQGQRLLFERKAAEARPLFEQGLAIDSANPHVRAGLAESLLKLNEPQAALPHAQAAIKLRPKRARYQVLMGDVLASLGKLDDAQTAWKKALELDPNEPEAKTRLK